MSPSAPVSITAVPPLGQACDHDGTCHGQLRSTSEPGVLRAIVVCSACGETVQLRETVEYAPMPDLTPAAQEMPVAA